MNLYEEFGLSSTATPDQIRHAHRTMARLLHPDNFQDEELRRLAELQMKRINGIYTVLADPLSREEYNRNMTMVVDHAPAVRTGPPLLRVRWGDKLREKAVADTLKRNMVWVVATLVTVFGINWFLSTQTSNTVAAQPYSEEVQPRRTEKQVAAPVLVKPKQAHNKAQHQPQPADADDVRQLAREAKQLRQMLEQTKEERDSAVSRLSELRPSPSIPPLATPAAVAAVEPTPGPAASAPSPSSPQARSNLLAGTWVYLPGIRTSGDLYPAEYIELIIGGQGGTLLGRYRGRYRVADRAISPEVQFAFEGQAGGGNRFQWTGNGGAKGEVELKRLSENALSVDWHTTQLGRQVSLSSGTAVLVRRQEQ